MNSVPDLHECASTPPLKEHAASMLSSRRNAERGQMQTAFAPSPQKAANFPCDGGG